jgi:hypothetical protein
MKFVTFATLLSTLLLGACGSGYGTWSPRRTEVTNPSPANCQSGYGICPGQYGRGGQMRHSS